MQHRLIVKAENTPNLKYIFCDFYDTLIHRSVHPMEPFRIWAKILIRELGLKISIKSLYEIRKSSMRFLSRQENIRECEVNYELNILEVYNRLVTTDKMSQSLDFETFYECSRSADFISESQSQYLNQSLLKALIILKSKGYKIYCVSDFHFDEELMKKLLVFHGLSCLYDNIYISSSEIASKENGGILFQKILKKEKINPGEVLMVGDNQKSDFLNARLHGIESVHLKHLKHKYLQKFRLFGNDRKDFIKSMKIAETLLKSNKYIYAEYLIIFHFFIERLYTKAKREGIKNLFFLAREGHFLKLLFDTYQKEIGLIEDNVINTHYLKMSRQGAMQISYKPLLEEDFKFLKSKHNILSLKQFLKSFLFTDELINDLAIILKVDFNEEYQNFFESPTFKNLIDENIFKKNYETNRINQKKCFNNYISSFEVDIKAEGMHIVDVGWGGTMQECLYDYFDSKIPISGYYLGVQEIYTITEMTKRYGLIFSVYPYAMDNDYIMMANRQLYEQLLAAPHGSTLGYKNSDGFTIEYHEKKEKYIYENQIEPIQEFMLSKYTSIIDIIEKSCYNTDLVSDYLVKLKLKSDLIASKDKISFINGVSQGFYQNIGNNNIGIVYNIEDIGKTRFSLIKNIFFRSSKMFRYVVKIKLALYNKNLYFVGLPLNLFGIYLKFYISFKKKFLNKNLIH